MTSELVTPEMIEAGVAQMVRLSHSHSMNDVVTAIYTAMRSSLPNPEGMTEALRKAHEFAVLFLAFDGRDRHTNRMDKTFDSLSKMAVEVDAMSRAALSTRSEGQVTVVQPCPPHQWGHAPTVGYFECLKCRERVNYDDPRYDELVKERAALSSTTRVGADEDAELVERLRQEAEDSMNRDLARDAMKLAAERISSRDDGLREAVVALADAADKCSEAPHFIVQPFLNVYRQHGETIAKARALSAQGSDRHG